MIDRKSARVGTLLATNRLRASAWAVAVMFAMATTPAHADNGDCGQPLTNGASPTASDSLFILKSAVGSVTCDPECICAPKGSLPISASDALLTLRFAVGNSVTLNCPCDGPTTTTTIGPSTTTTLGSGVVGAIPLKGRMNANLMLGLPAATAACQEHFPGSDYCEYSEIVASQGARLAGLEDINGAAVTSFWAIDPNQPVGRQCGQTLDEEALRWTYATAHLGVGGDSVPLNNGTGMLGTLVVGGESNRNCNVVKSVACCR